MGIFNGLLAALGPKALAAAPILVSRAEVESDVEVWKSMAAAVAAGGEKVVPGLVSLLGSEKLRAVEFASASLELMGGIAAEEVARNCLSSATNEQARTFGLAFFRHVGSKAAGAISLLAQMLDEATDDETAGSVVVAIHSCGPTAARAAVGALIRCLLTRTTEVAAWAASTIRMIGPYAIPDLKTALGSAAESKRQPLEDLLRFLQPAGDDRFGKFALIKRDLLDVFVAVGDVFTKHGPLGWRRVERAIETQIHSGTCSLKRFSASKLSASIKLLSRELKTTMTTHKNKRPGTLTKEAAELLPDVKAFLKLYGVDRENS